VKKPSLILSVDSHDRDTAGLHYIYPVISRRSSGVSLGINLNPNNACNWHCVYCQVPGLSRGSAPAIDLNLLEHELSLFLHAIKYGNFMQEHVPEGFRQLSDIAISGNGEPTGSRQFNQVTCIIEEALNHFGLTGTIKVILITNGSYMQRQEVQAGLKHLAQINGEVWFKIDRVRFEDVLRENGVAWGEDRIRRSIEISAQLCPTCIQTCMHGWNGCEPEQESIIAYLNLLKELKLSFIPIRSIFLYGLARPSMQKESRYISPLSSSWMNTLASRIRALDYTVTVSM